MDQGIYPGISTRDYLRENFDDDRPCFSSSTAHTLVTESPLRAWANHSRLGGVPREQTEEMEEGDIFHSLLLGTGKEIAIVAAKDWRTNAAKDARAAAQAEGKIAMLADRAAKYQGAAEIIKRRLADEGIDLSQGQNEVTAIWDEKGVRCKARFDNYFQKMRYTRIIDLKKTESVRMDNVVKSTEKYGYDIQGAAYISAIEHLKPTDGIEFLFVFFEAKPPYDVRIAPLANSMYAIGKDRWERARDEWRQCLATRKWPGAARGEREPLEASQFHQAKELEAQIKASGKIPF